MGYTCACGNKVHEKCACDWKDWHDLTKNKNDIPKENGTYKVRISDEAGCGEDISEFSIIKKKWERPTNESISHWEKDYYDGYMGHENVYAWKEGKE